MKCTVVNVNGVRAASHRKQEGAVTPVELAAIRERHERTRQTPIALLSYLEASSHTDRGTLLAAVERLTRERDSADREIDRLQAAIIEVERILIRSEAGATHWDGCESQHPACAALAVIAGLMR